jgi:hypothetical protein
LQVSHVAFQNLVLAREVGELFRAAILLVHVLVADPIRERESLERDLTSVKRDLTSG